jgi:hypothetical protein
VSDELVAALIGVGGLVVGFFLNEWTVERRYRRQRRESRQAMRAVLQVEMERNVEALRAWKAGKDLPTQSNQIWASQLSALPTALSPKEIRAAHDFYYELYNLKKLPSHELDEALARFVARPLPLERDHSATAA